MTSQQASQREDALSSIAPGAVLGFLGQVWHLTRIINREGRVYFSIDLLDSEVDAHDCIAANGADGPWELLEPAAGSEEASAMLVGESPMLGQRVSPCETAGASSDPIASAGEPAMVAGESPVPGLKSPRETAGAPAGAITPQGASSHGRWGDPTPPEAQASKPAPGCRGVETARPSWGVIASPVDDWRFRSRPWRP